MDKHTYTVCGEAACLQDKAEDGRGTIITVSSRRALQALDGTRAAGDFSKHWDEAPGLEEAVRVHHPASRPRLIFRYDAKAGRLTAQTAYSFTRPLSKAEVRALKSYTTHQWSEGIGKRFEERYVKDVFLLSPNPLLPKTAPAVVETHPPEPGPARDAAPLASLDF